MKKKLLFFQKRKKMCEYINLTDDLILYTWSYIENNNDMCHLRQTCKKIHKLTEQYGYIKELKCNMNKSSYMNYIMMSRISYHKALIKITVENMQNPFSWIPTKWPRKMIFSHCYFGNKKLIPPESITEELTILVVSDRSHYSYLNIDYSKLPKLKKVYIITPDMNLESLKDCKNLEVIVLNLTNCSKKELPKWIANLTKLKTLVVNCEAKEALHFVSPYLKTLLFYKKQPCTSIVKTIPYRHLSENINFNVEAMNYSN